MHLTDTALVVGDIHGCLDKLTELLVDVPSNVQIYAVGDIIDRGPDSRGVINFIRDNNILTVRGNHEQIAIDCLPALRSYIYDNSQVAMYDLYASNWFSNGGRDVFNQYEVTDDLPQLIIDIEYLATLPLYIKTGILDSYGLELLVSHTWTSYRNLERAVNTQFDFVWNRDQPTGIVNNSKYYNCFGHTPVGYVNSSPNHPVPNFYDGACNLDTGAPYRSPGRGVLSGVYFPSLDVTQSTKG